MLTNCIKDLLNLKGVIVKSVKNLKDVVEIYPKFIINNKSSDLMIRGGDFYAIWIEELGIWSTDEAEALRLIDQELDKFKEELRAAECVEEEDSDDVDETNDETSEKTNDETTEETDNDVIVDDETSIPEPMDVEKIANQIK